jgi:hypothetical protein
MIAQPGGCLDPRSMAQRLFDVVLVHDFLSRPDRGSAMRDFNRSSAWRRRYFTVLVATLSASAVSWMDNAW